MKTYSHIIIIVISIAIIESIMVVIPVLGSASDIKPDHPRIWLTPEKLNILKARATANTPEWQRFKKVADTFLNNINKWVAEGKDPNKKPYNGNEYIYTLALAYRITNDIKYANAALTVLNDIIYAFDFLNQAWGGAYYARNYAVQFAIGYDWLYDQLSEADKIRLYEKMNQWTESYFDPVKSSWAQNNPHNNFFYGRIVGGGLTAIATYGDNPRAQEWFDLVRYIKYENIAKPALLEYGKDGGLMFESTGYSLNMLEFLYKYLLALKTATGENLFSELPGVENLIYYITHITQPTLDRLLPLGNEETDVLKDYVRRPMLIIADLFKGTVSGEYAQWYLNHNIGASKINDDIYIWHDLFWYNPDMPERNIDKLPLDYFDKGTGLIFSRSGWENDATWISLTAGGKDTIQTGQHKDQNAFSIFKNAWLAAPDPLIGGYGYTSSKYSNTIFISNGNEDLGSEFFQAGSWERPARIEKFESNPDYVYTVGQAAGVYREFYYRPYIMDNYHRGIVFFRSGYLVIFDRINLRKKDPLDNKEYYPVWTVKSLIKPTISGDLVTIVNGNGKMFIKTLFANNITTKQLLKGWDTQLTNSMKTNDKHTFLNVFYVGDISIASMPETVRVDGTNMVGAQIADRVVMFSKEEIQLANGQFNITGSGVYKTIIADLIPNANYNIYIDENILDTYTASNSGIVYFDLPLDGSHSINISTGPVDNIKPSAISNLSATTGAQPGSVVLTWTSPGDDGNIGTATSYTIRYYTLEINNSNWDSAFDIDGEPSPQSAGNTETFILTGLTPGQAYYFAIKTLDEVGNISDISNSPKAIARTETLKQPGKPIHIDSGGF